ncbi:hypothetical protein AAFN85_24515 [Mucilaginibacter sp. CAU 1740]|uniref:hypothetical protein n=1 Tax=Mucilaginibacter sp. CAU 1740 TaxID=3140365 RepID=UPI00325B8628
MKKLFLILFAGLCLSAQAQTQLDVGDYYSASRIVEIRDYITTFTPKDYKFYSYGGPNITDSSIVGKEYSFRLTNFKSYDEKVDVDIERPDYDHTITKITIMGPIVLIDSIFNSTFKRDKNLKIKKDLGTNISEIHQAVFMLGTSNEYYDEYVTLFKAEPGRKRLEIEAVRAVKPTVKAVWTKADEELYGSQAEKVHQDMIERQAGYSLVRIIGFKEYYTNEISSYLQQNGYRLEDSPDRKGSFNYVFSPSYIGTQKAPKLRMSFMVNQSHRVTSGTITGSLFDLASLFLYYWPQSAEWRTRAQLKRGVVAQKHNFGDLITFGWNGVTPVIRITKDPNISMPVPPLKN